MGDSYGLRRHGGGGRPPLLPGGGDDLGIGLVGPVVLLGGGLGACPEEMRPGTTRSEGTGCRLAGFADGRSLRPGSLGCPTPAFRPDGLSDACCALPAVLRTFPPRAATTLPPLTTSESGMMPLPA